MLFSFHIENGLSVRLEIAISNEVLKVVAVYALFLMSLGIEFHRAVSINGKDLKKSFCCFVSFRFGLKVVVKGYHFFPLLNSLFAVPLTPTGFDESFLL